LKRHWFTRSVPVILTLALCALPLALGVSCTPNQAAANKIVVAVTILPQDEFVEAVGGDKVSVSVMIPPGASPHSYEPTPAQMTELSQAAMYAKVGSGIEFELVWMDDLIALNEEMLVVDCAQGVELRVMTSDHEHEEASHEHTGFDPHIWMSPRNAQIMVQNIASGLIQVDPASRDYYEQNRDTYLEKLTRLDQDIRDSLSGVANRVFMVYHPSFGYFADRYDLTMLPVEAEGKEPTPAGLQHVIEQAKEHNIRVVFAEPQFNPKSANVIADAIDGQVILIDPLARDYITNLDAILGKLVSAME
jgi:zinc transport system substrate-binding protein